MEQRNCRETLKYNTMSPFMNADKMKTPMLLVHGEADNREHLMLQTNVIFKLWKGLGALARMVILQKKRTVM
jgi:dipeptidyl aminopeptidase/acylaminoacyl peptidase